MALINDSPYGNLNMCDVGMSQVFQGSSQNLDHTWFLNSRCSRHMIGLRSLLIGFLEKKGPIMVFGDNNEESFMGVGRFECKAFKLKEVFYVKGLKNNLISLS